MKKSLAILGVLGVALVYGQENEFIGRVGVNTETPNATLEVAGKPTNTDVLDGIIAPKITGDQLNAKNYTKKQTGALVYVTDAATTENRVGQTINVDEKGYYYFDGTAWQKQGGSGTIATNIYEGDGTLKTNRTVSIGDKNLTFTGTNTDPLIILTNSKAKVGSITDNQEAVQYPTLQIKDGGQGKGQILTSDKDGNASWQPLVVPMEPILLTGTTHMEIQAGEDRLKYTGLSWKVYPGKWLFTLTIGVQQAQTSKYEPGSTFLRFRLFAEGYDKTILDTGLKKTETSTVDGQTTTKEVYYLPNSQKYETSTKSFGPKYASTGIPFSVPQTTLVGTIGINNNTGKPMQVYLYADTISSKTDYQKEPSTPVGKRLILRFGDWVESTIMAMKVGEIDRID